MAVKPLNIGVFAPHPVQLLDLASIDVLASMSASYLQNGTTPKLLEAAALAPETRLFYISSPEQGHEISTSANAAVKAPYLYTDPEVAPGRLDIVVVPGCSPKQKFDLDAIEWLRQQGNTEGVDILSVCTGIFLCGAAGLGDGKKVCGPRMMLEELKDKFPTMNLVGEEYRWMKDGNFWSSGEVTNGNDLMAAYARGSGRFHSQVAEAGCELTDVGDRGQVRAARDERSVVY